MRKTPRTDEAVERWQQGKANLIEEMAKMELDLYEECRLNGMGSEREAALKDKVCRLQDQLHCAIWCLDKAKEREQKHVGQWVDAKSTPDAFESKDHDNDDYTYHENYKQ
jgi:hypothetical protein